MIQAPTNAIEPLEKPPIFPGFLAAPFKVLPAKIHSKLLVHFLNKILPEQISDGDLDFLNNKRLCISVSDAGLSFFISLVNHQLVSIPPSSSNDIKVEACIYDFLQLAARQQDPDTLVFQRRLVMQGDTELGLELKNFLDALDLESSGNFAKIETLLIKSLPIYRRLFG